ncbi:uncharacterized protein N7479_006155 [Penicillium vulpinum]|nr:uncharacterized protein N7479_006155 [Penicillium vulpinum]KAJ5959005.1 hypothetical protein N7479_006155 [Penicillium vulpinum]
MAGLGRVVPDRTDPGANGATDIKWGAGIVGTIPEGRPELENFRASGTKVERGGAPSPTPKHDSKMFFPLAH